MKMMDTEGNLIDVALEFYLVSGIRLDEFMASAESGDMLRVRAANAECRVLKLPHDMLLKIIEELKLRGILDD